MERIDERMYDEIDRGNLLKRKAFLEKVIKEKEIALRKAPEGRLRFSTRGNQVYYYQRIDPEDNSGTYIKRSEMQKAAKLAQKDYDYKVLKGAEKELKQLDIILSGLEMEKIETIYDQLPPQRQVLVKPAVLSNEAYAREWQETKYEGKGFTEEDTELFTDKGERVRSKSEVLIANALAKYGVPYHYEFPLLIPGFGTYHPDFTALNIRRRKIFIWEHFGMMDDPSYSGKALTRIDLFERNGYLPGKNMILTLESLARPLNTKQIKNMIEHYLL